MKTTLFLLSVIALIAVVRSETCTGHDVSTCPNEKCTGNYELVCHNGECTCLVSSCFTGQASCHTHKDHCDIVTHQLGCTCAHSWHCRNHRCYCGSKV